MHFFLFIFILGQIHRCPGCTVHDYIRLHFREDLLHRRLVCDIHGHIRHRLHRSAILDAAVLFLNVRADSFIAAASQLIHHIMPKLSCHTSHKYFHYLISSRFPYIFS